jgi:hypothetical protein
MSPAVRSLTNKRWINDYHLDSNTRLVTRIGLATMAPEKRKLKAKLEKSTK